MKLRNSGKRGNAMVEMALIFIPMTMAMFSATELSRGMWMYHTLAAAVKTGARTATVHGAECEAATSACPATASAVASAVRSSGIGLESDHLQLTLVADGASYSCGSLTQCLNDTTQWPPAGHNQPGLSITVTGVYAFHSVLSVLWPGQGSASIHYLAEATDTIQY